MRRLVFGLALLTLSGCRGIQVGFVETTSAKVPREQAAATAPPPPPAPANPFASLERDLATALAEKDALVAIEKLGLIRVELLRRHREGIEAWKPRVVTKPEEQHSVMWAKEQAPDVLGRAGIMLLRRTHHERAKLYLTLNDSLAALRELAVSELSNNLNDVWNRPTTPLLACAAEEGTCKEARTAILAKYPGICFDEGSCVIDREGFPQAGKGYALVGINIESTKRAKSNDWVVKGAASVPSSYDDCIGRYETDKILSVEENYIRVQRTTWCTRLVKKQRRGHQATYRIKTPDVDLSKREYIEVLVDRSKIKTTTTKDFVRDSITDVQTVTTDAGSERYLSYRVPKAQ